MLGIDLFGLLHHLERLVIAAGGDAGRAALAEIADEDGEDAAGAGRLALRRREDGIDLLIGHRHLVDDVEELRLRFGGEAVDRLGDFANDLRQRRACLHLRDHALARLLLDLGQLGEHLGALAGVAHVARNRHASAPCPDPARCWAARCPGKPRCTPCTACSSRECRAGSRGARRTWMRCRRWPRRSRPWPRAAWRADRSRSWSGTPRRTRRWLTPVAARPVPAGGGVERQPPVVQLSPPPTVAISRIGQQRPGRAGWSGRPRPSSPISISFTRSKP